MSISVRDVAKFAGVSVGTVSNVLNRPDRVAPGTVDRVLEAIATLGFVRNDAARQLRAGQSRTIGLVVLEAGNPFFTDLAQGVEARAHERGFFVLLANSDDDAERERAILELFEQQRVAGVIVSPRGDDPAMIARLQRQGIHVVLVERESSDATVSSVAVDNVAGGQMAVEHLAALGRRRIAYVGGPASIRQVSERLVGTTRAMAQIPGMTCEVMEAPSLTVLDGRVAGEQIAARPQASRPDGIFAANDLLAIGVIQGLLAGGVDVPAEIAVIGYDDIDFAASLEVPLSSIRQPSRAIGQTAIDMLLARVADSTAPAKHVVFHPELVVRASTGVPADAASAETHISGQK